jgi:hypothetical protein
MRTILSVLLIGLAIAATWLTPGPAHAIPAFSRMFGQSCGACHNGVPRLNQAGEEFRLSGYTRYEGGAAIPKVPPITVGKLSLPGIVPISLRGIVGFDVNHLEERDTADGSTRSFDPNSINLEEFSILAAAPLNHYLSFFVDFPIAHTEFDRDTRRFNLNGPDKPELAYVSLNNLFFDDLLNLKAGVAELPVGFSPEHRRLTASPYEIYQATAQKLLRLEGPAQTGIADEEFSLAEGQLLIALYGNLYSERLGISDLYFRYQIGTANDTNVNGDNNEAKSIFGRLEVGWLGQTLGFFGLFSPNILDKTRPEGFLGTRDQVRRLGPDLHLRFFDEALNFSFQYLWAHDSDPTGLGQSFNYSGGFAQADYLVKVGSWGNLLPLVRFDYVKGDKFDDTDRALAAGLGPIRTKPRIWAITGGLQYYPWDNVRIVAEGTYRETSDQLSRSESTVEKDRIRETIFTVRLDFNL